MKILLTTDPEIPVPPEAYGGAERVADNLARGLKEEGHRVLLLAHPGSTCVWVEKVIGWIGLSSVGAGNIWKNARQLLKVLRAEKPDAVICFSRILYLYPAWLFTRHRFIKRYGRYISPDSNRLANFLLRKRIHYTPNAAHMTGHLRKQHKYTPIHSSVDTDFYTPGDAAPGDYFLFLGRIEAIKGTAEAVEAALLAKRKLVIAGNHHPEHKAYFETHVRAHAGNGLIEYTGPVNNEQKRTLLRGALALLQPFSLEAEAFPSTVIEALSCGVPVIGFPIPALREAIRDGVNGYLVETPEAMAEAMEKVDSLDRNAIREDAVERFSIANTTRQFLQLIKNQSES